LSDYYNDNDSKFLDSADPLLDTLSHNRFAVGDCVRSGRDRSFVTHGTPRSATAATAAAAQVVHGETIVREDCMQSRFDDVAPTKSILRTIETF